MYSLPAIRTATRPFTRTIRGIFVFTASVKETPKVLVVIRESALVNRLLTLTLPVLVVVREIAFAVEMFLDWDAVEVVVLVKGRMYPAARPTAGALVVLALSDRR